MNDFDKVLQTEVLVVTRDSALSKSQNVISVKLFKAEK